MGNRELIYLKLLFPFMAGILLAVFYPVIIIIPLIASVVFAITVIFLHCDKGVKTYSANWAPGIVITLFMLSCGNLITLSHKQINDQTHFSRHYLENAEWVVRLTEPPAMIGEVYQLKAEVVTVLQAKKAVGTTGKIVIYLPINKLSSQLKYGDLIESKAAIHEIPPPANPHEFDRRAYVSWQQYYHQATIFDNQWKPLGINKGNPFFKCVFATREACINTLGKYLQGEPLAVTASLLLGYRELLNNELLKSYTAAGVVYIFSISGLHVGLLIWAAAWLLGLLRVPDNYQWLKYAVIIVLVLLFACLTGLSSPILRAAVVSSFLLVAKIIRRDVNILNGLAASAFFLFIINPFLVMDIGFQLSYIAVTGIALLYPFIYRLLYFSWRPVNWLWQSISLSLAATISMLPLTLYYFHQAPVYFILSNLAVIPLLPLIMGAGALLLVVSPFKWITVYIAKLATLLIFVMGYCIKTIAQLPMAQVNGIAIYWEEALLMGVAIVLFMVFIQNRKIKLLMLSIAVLTAFIVYGIPRQKLQSAQKQLVVYSVSKHTAIDLVDGNQDLMLVDETLPMDEKAWAQHIAASRWYMGLGDPMIECINEESSKFKWQGTWRNGDYVQFYNKKLVVVTSWKKPLAPQNKLHIDYLLLSANAPVNLHEIVNAVEPKLVIFDASNSMKKVNQWADECKDLKLPYYDTRLQGAYVASISDSSIAE